MNYQLQEGWVTLKRLIKQPTYIKRLIIFSIENLRDSSVLTSLTVTFLSLCTLCRSDWLPLEPNPNRYRMYQYPATKYPICTCIMQLFICIPCLQSVCVCVRPERQTQRTAVSACLSLQHLRPGELLSVEYRSPHWLPLCYPSLSSFSISLMINPAPSPPAFLPCLYSLPHTI